jgi:hypothetical protein
MEKFDDIRRFSDPSSSGDLGLKGLCVNVYRGHFYLLTAILMSAPLFHFSIILMLSQYVT